MAGRETTVARLARQLIAAVFFVLATVVCGLASAQSVAPGGAPFNHNATGFVLDSAHAKQSCESCHTQGLFRGTPRECGQCHQPGGRAPGKPASHMPTSATCDSCHLSASWTPSSFKHQITQGVIQGSCSSCHSGGTVSGKPATHLLTSAPCDSCHKTASWLPAGFTHALVPAGGCASCHNGSKATGKAASHIPTSASCDACHATGISWAPLAVSIGSIHSNMAGPAAARNCSTCHGGGFVSQNAQSKPLTHVATTAQCDTCHASTTTWATAIFDHTTVPTAGVCGTACHNGSAGAGLSKPSNHVPTSGQCDSCHNNFNAFKPALMNHVGTVGQCATCHNGSYNFANAQARPAAHIPTTAQCDTCHISGFLSWSPAAMNHAGMAGRCVSCHSGGFVTQNAQTKPATHIATTAQCDSCHTSTSSWATAIFNHAAASPAVAGRCSSCHNSVAALGKPVSHIPTSAQCDACHTSFSAFRPAVMSHAGTSGQCSTCHNGSYLFANALTRPINHIPATAQCDTCHVSGTVSWSPATMNHSGLSGLCATCHSGAYLAQNAQIKPSTHVGTTAQCDTCHSSTATWATAVYAHSASAGGACSTCHNGATALGKPTNHIPTTEQCDTCHTTFSAFKPSRMNHAGTAGTCATCHSGSYVFANALGKTVNHIPTVSQCDSCHTRGFATWSPSVMNHAGLAAQCSTCHSGTYLTQNAQTKPVTHIATTAQCDTCHSSTTTWATGVYAHPAPVAVCSSCHNGTSALGKPTTHIPTTATCNTCHTSFAAFAPAAMSHTGTAGPVATGNCATCHGGTYVAINAQSKSPTHLATSAQCDTCHRSTVTWAGASYAHDASATGNCSTCHNGGAALGKPATHIPSSGQCDTCHNSFTTFKPARMNHSGTADLCSTCHSGTYTAVNALAKPVTHIPTGAAQCDSCHINGFVAFSPSLMSHAAVGALVGAHTCSTCHSGSYVSQNAQVKTTTHIPTTAECDTCHSSNSTWATGVFAHTAPVAVCSTCHNGTAALGKPTNHIPTAATCNTCHSGFVAFAPAVMSHSGTSGPLAAGNCATCHGGAYLAVNAQVKPATHIPTTQSCDSCHTSVAWKPTSFAHTGVVAGSCATCHNGSNALGKTASHLPTSAACDVCHSSYSAFAPTRMNHAGASGPVTAGNCSTCHAGAYLAINAQVKPVTHVSTTAQCDTCHRSTVSWATASYAHPATAFGTCSGCHNGTTALGKPTTHIPTTAQCDTCHNNFVGFRPAVMSHSGTTGPLATANCATCHSGSYTAVNALSKSATHIPTTAQCDSCHTRGFATWSPSTMNHTGLASQCSTCHSGAYLAQNAQTKPATHIPTTAQCDTCHSSTTTWATGVFTHTAPVAVCSTCHNGTNALGKPTNHIPTTATCNTCHTSFAAFAPATMSHTGTSGPVAAGNCATCHSGSYVAVNALAKPVTHIATSTQCDSCHSSTSTWTGASYTHAPTAVGTCSTCHNGSAALGKPATHIPTTGQCDTCHSGYTAFRPALMSHRGTVGQCSTCHNGSYTAVNALAKPATHIPTGAAQCDSCHINGFVSFLPSLMSHAAVGALVGAHNCSTCHSGSYVSQNAQVKTPTHIPTTAECDTCHSSNSTWATGVFTHTAPVAVCSTCHNGTAALGKPTNHIPTAATCNTCHSGFVAFAPAVMSHSGTSGPLAAGNCASCHGGAYLAVNAQAKPATHIPTTQSCDSCHTSVAWKPTSYSHAGVVAGSCATCHNGSNALGKTASHLPTSAACDVCHSSYSAFAPTRMNHAGASGPGAAGNCSTCHGGAYLAINAQVKPTTHVSTTAQCDTCHRSTASWATATYTHDAAAVGRCSSCHNGTTALGKPSTHIPTTAQCDTCHNNFVGFRPALMSHSGTSGPLAAGNCATCHSGSYVAVNALAKPATHIPTTALCDSCHTLGFSSWSPAVMNHGTRTDCTTCHNGAYIAQNAQMKTPTHIPTTAQCGTCHSSRTTWATGVFTHTAPVAVCSTCHNGTNALGKPTGHIPTTATCNTCHTSFAAFAPATMSHTGTTGPVATGNCTSCHGGAYVAVNAQTKTATHIPTTQSCDVCHGTTAWKPTSFAHTGVVAGSCATCHNGISAAGKSTPHIPSTASCDSCHRTGLSWLPVITPWAHTGVAAGTCGTCHISSYPNMDVKPSSHLPTTASCDACHRSFSVWLPATYAHTGVAPGTCQTCHNGAYTGIMAKPSNHIPTTTPAGMPGNECSLCHSSTTSFAVERMNHGTMTTSCATCHDRSSIYLGSMDKINRASHHSAGAKDCSSSGCHKPLGSKGRPYSAWN